MIDMSMKEVTEEVMYTYEQWQNRGCQVREGEKSKHRDFDGKPLFTASQVDEDIDELDEEEYSCEFDEPGGW